MNSEDPIGIIELGNVSLKCIIFKFNENNTEILSTAKATSEGLQNDTVTNLSKASNAIRLCISMAEKEAKISLKKIYVILEQPDFLCTTFSKYKKINGSKIYKDDIEFLLKEAKKQLILNDKTHSIIHIFNHNYIVDGKKFNVEPIGVYADSLTHEITFITIPQNNLKNIYQIFINCDIEVERLISRTFTLGVELLSNDELELGSAIVDLGSEKISFVIFKNLTPLHSKTFPIGINHIAKDVSKVCSLNLEDSKNIISKFDLSLQNNSNFFDENGYLKNIYFINSNFRKISESLITSVIKARADEIIEILKKQLVVPGFNISSRINLLLTGGGSNLSNIQKYFANFFGPNVKIAYKKSTKENESLEKNFTSCLGAIKIIKDGWETEAIPKNANENIENAGFFAKIFNISR